MARSYSPVGANPGRHASLVYSWTDAQVRSCNFLGLPLRKGWQNNVLMASLLNLNLEQRRAVEHGAGPLLVIAGPGSGKTRVITERIVYLLQNSKLPENLRNTQPENILALTFTEKAAEEMKRRVEEALPGLGKLPHISTFHAFCYHVLRERHFERSLLDKIDVWIFLRRRMERLGLDFYQKLAEPGAFLHDLNEFFSRCQDELIEPNDFEAYVEKIEKSFSRHANDGGPVPPGELRPPLQAAGLRIELCATNAPGLQGEPCATKVVREEIGKKKELARVFRRSRQLIEDAGCSSLGSLISETVRLWDCEPEVLERYRARFSFVLVDEFQDTNYAQVELLRRLVTWPYNITAVGDDDQAIYRFRGASYGAFQMFDQAFPGHETVYLDRNYRSTKKILRAADVVIAKNDRYAEKKPLKTENPEGCNVYLLEAPDYRSEAVWIAEEVERLTQCAESLSGVAAGPPRHSPWRHKAAATPGQVSFGDIAVLYRSHNYRDLLVDGFRRRSIPFTIRGLSILSTAVLRDLIAYLNLVHSPHHNVSLTRVLVAPRWRFPEELALEIRKQAAKDRCSLFDVLEAREPMLLSQELESTGWPELKKLLRGLRGAAQHISITSLLDLLIGGLELLFLPGDQDQVYVSVFRTFLEDWEKKSETGKLQEFIEYFSYFREAGGQIELPEGPEPPDQSNAVQMMTVHAAKGLEFPVVFVLSVARQRFPHREEIPVIEFPDALRKGPPAPPDIHLQEERRLFYVAMTRARERLYISSVGKAGKKFSVFVEDLLSDPVVAACDIERIQARPVGAGLAPPIGGAARSAPTITQRHGVPLHAYPRPTSQEHVQGSLFGDAAPPSRAAMSPVRPGIREWASRPPAEELAGPDGKLQLSATAIEAYRDCPLKFKFTYCLKIPTAPQATLTFGNIMHQCVRHYFNVRKGQVPRFEDIEDFYLRSWKDVGFEDSYQEQAYKKAGLEQLREFVERQNGSTIPAESIALEQRFALDLGDVALVGRIDQINPIENLVADSSNLEAVEAYSGSAGVPRQAGAKMGALPRQTGSSGKPVAELIDYKTGRPRSQKDADKSLQLSVYALAARRLLGVEPVRLTFYNLTNNQPVSTVRTTKDLGSAVGEIGEVAARIRQRLFDPTPGFACKRCEFVPICPAHEGQ